MKHRRYGRLNVGDYIITWCSIPISVVLLIFFINKNVPLIINISLVLIEALNLCITFWPYREKFVINDNSIDVSFGKTTRSITLPSQLTLVVSRLDICSPLSGKAYYTKTKIIKSKCAISILQKISLDDALNILHKIPVRKYTDSSLELAFEDDYIYSFACDQAVLDSIIANRDCTLIIPESLKDKVSFDKSGMNVYIDSEG